MNLCIASVCDRQYAPGFAKMAKTLRQYVPDCPPVLQISYDGWRHPDADDVILAPGYGRLKSRKNYANAYHILEAFRLPFDVVVAVDADMIFLQDPSPSWQDPSAAISLCKDDGGNGHRLLHPAGGIHVHNSGYMVIRPEAVKYDRLVEIARSGKSYDGGDQGAINLYLQETKDFETLPIQYNMIKRWCVRNPDTFWHWYEQGKIIGVHFVGRKPWIRSDPGYERIEKLWHDA